MNTFLNTIKEKKNLNKVSAVQVPNISLDAFVPTVSADELRRFGFQGFLKDMVQAPECVMAYMCKNYHLHDIPVFNQNAEKFNDQLVHEVGLRRFFSVTKCKRSVDPGTPQRKL